MKRADRKKLSEPFKETCPLLVEGRDDLFVVAAIADKLGLPCNFYIHDGKGYPNILTILETRLKSNEYQRIGLVVDADSDSSQRWREICKAFSPYDIHLPDEPDENGLVLELDAKRVGVWLMPDNKQAGMLEDLYQTFIPNDDKLAPLVNDSLNRVESLDLQRYKHRSKAFVHTWLAWQEDPGMPMGRSISDDNLVDTKTAKPFANWLERLFPSEQTET